MLRSLAVPLGLAVLCAAMLITYRPASAAATHSISNIAGLSNAMMAYGSSADRSKIAGRTTATPVRPAVHSGGAITTLGTLSGFAHSQAYDVNDAGQVTGWATNSNFGFGFTPGERAFVFSGGAITQIPDLAGATFTHAFAINNAGTVVGISGTNRPFKFNIGDATSTPLPFPAGGDGGGRALDINTAGDIVGFEFANFPQKRPVVWDGGVTPIALPLPAGTTQAEASVINDAGVIAGTAFYGAGIGTRGFFYDAAGAPVDMGTLGAGFISHEVFDINSSREAIGRAFNNTTFTFAPFLYRQGTMVNLNSLIPAGSGWVLQRAISINDAGEIIGIGTLNGTSAGFKLTPIPEPTALAGLAMMALAAASRRRRDRARHRAG